MRRASALAGPLVLLLLVVGVYWKLLTKQYTWMDHPDMANQVLPWYQFQAASWQARELPLWDPHIWGGQPLAGQLQPGAVYPPNWLLFALPLEAGYLQQRWPQWSFLLTHYFGALFCYWLCRDLGRSRGASVLAGGAFAVGGILGSLGWPQMLNSAIWLPLIMLFFLRSQRGPRRIAPAAWAGVFLGVAFLAGHHQIPIFVLLTLTGLWSYAIWRNRARSLASAAAFLASTILTGALQFLPAYEYGVRSIRFVGLPYGIAWDQSVPYPVHEQYSLFPREVLGLVLAHVTDHDVFMGLAVFTLAAYGAVAARLAEVRLMIAMGAASLLLAFGGLSVFHGVLYVLLPGFDKARSPVMALVIAQFALAVLAACGLDRLRSEAAGPRWIRALAIAGCAPWPVLAAVSLVRDEASREYERLAVFGLVALTLSATLHFWRSQRISSVALAGISILLMVFEVGTVTGQNYHHRDSPGGYLARLGQDRDVADFLRAQSDFVRLEVDVESVPYNIGDWEGIDQMQGYLASLTTNVARYFGEPGIRTNLGPKLFALSHYLGRAPSREGQQEIFRSKSGLIVYRNPDSFPRVWAVHEAIQVGKEDLIPRTAGGDPLRQVFLLGTAPALESCGEGDHVRQTYRSNNKIQLEAQMACRGMVILSAAYFPGWHAKVDGETVEIYEAYGVLRGVVVGPGTHQVEMEYRPATLTAGAVLTGLGLCLPFLLGFWERRRTDLAVS